MSIQTLLHTSPFSAHFHWEYQLLVLVALAGLWLFLAGRGERREPRSGIHKDAERR
jgi:hypothetical protein